MRLQGRGCRFNNGHYARRADGHDHGGRARTRRLAPWAVPGHHHGVEDNEATQLVLEALFDVKAAVYDIRDVLIDPPEDEDEGSEEDDT